MIIITALDSTKENSRILNFVKILKIRNSRKLTHAKITRSAVYIPIRSTNSHGAATERLKLMLWYITVYHLIFHAVLLLNNVFLIKPILYIYIYTYIHVGLYRQKIIMLYLIILPHMFFCIIFLYAFKYFILLLCIITFNIDYCYMYVLLLHTPSHVWPEFNKQLSIVYCRIHGGHLK